MNPQPPLPSPSHPQPHEQTLIFSMSSSANTAGETQARADPYAPVTNPFPAATTHFVRDARLHGTPSMGPAAGPVPYAAEALAFGLAGQGGPGAYYYSLPLGFPPSPPQPHPYLMTLLPGFAVPPSSFPPSPSAAAAAQAHVHAGHASNAMTPNSTNEPAPAVSMAPCRMPPSVVAEDGGSTPLSTTHATRRNHVGKDRLSDYKSSGSRQLPGGADVAVASPGPSRAYPSSAPVEEGRGGGHPQITVPHSRREGGGGGPHRTHKTKPTTHVVPAHGSVKLFVGQVPADVTEADIYTIFSFYGNVLNVTMQNKPPCPVMAAAAAAAAAAETSFSPPSSPSQGDGASSRSVARRKASAVAKASLSAKETIYAFVTFATMMEADVAIAALHSRYTLSTTTTTAVPPAVYRAKAAEETVKQGLRGGGSGGRDARGERPVTAAEAAAAAASRRQRPMQVSYARVTTNLSLFGFHHAMALHHHQSANPAPLKPSGRPTHYSWKARK